MGFFCLYCPSCLTSALYHTTAARTLKDEQRVNCCHWALPAMVRSKCITLADRGKQRLPNTRNTQVHTHKHIQEIRLLAFMETKYSTLSQVENHFDKKKSTHISYLCSPDHEFKYCIFSCNLHEGDLIYLLQLKLRWSSTHAYPQTKN